MYFFFTFFIRVQNFSNIDVIIRKSQAFSFILSNKYVLAFFYRSKRKKYVNNMFYFQVLLTCMTFQQPRGNDKKVTGIKFASLYIRGFSYIKLTFKV